MSTVAERLEGIHKRLCATVNPVTMMITKRKVSASKLSEIADSLETDANLIREFVREIGEKK